MCSSDLERMRQQRRELVTPGPPIQGIERLVGNHPPVGDLPDPGVQASCLIHQVVGQLDYPHDYSTRVSVAARWC